MVRIRTKRLTGTMRVIVCILAIAVIAALVRSVPLKKGIETFASEDGEKSTRDDIFTTIIDKTLPVIDASMNVQDGKESSQFIAYTLFKYITRIDFKNPRTYLTSQIPLLGLFEVNTFSAKAGVLSSRGTSITPTVTPGSAPEVTPVSTPEKSPNFGNDIPVSGKVDPDKPAVLIYHTHTTESYTPTPKYNYTMDGDYSTTDVNYNVCAVGEEMKKYIETYYGFAVAHDMTVHNRPSYTGSYKRSKPTVENLLKKYPEAKFVIDLHRDASVDRKDMVADVRGEQAAKIMFVVQKNNPHWQENYHLAQKLSQKIEELFPGMVRRISVVERIIYNQEISNKALLIEVGADCNTLEESLVSAKMVGKAIGELLKGN